jgi:diaminopimelate decarboxylase
MPSFEPYFTYKDNSLFAEDVSLESIAKTHGTPTFVYSKKHILDAYQEFADAAAARPLGAPVMVCYAIKANSNLAILNILAKAGAGFDIVSGGELERVIAAGGSPSKIVFSGVGKKREELLQALEVGVRCFNVESESELARLSELAVSVNKTAHVSLRVNPNVDAGTHPYISTGLKENKFGIAHERTLEVYKLAAKLPNLKVTGIDCHIGSQITDIAPFMAALEKVLELFDQLSNAGIELTHLDLGGGLGIPYKAGEIPPKRAYLLAKVFERLAQHPKARSLEVMFEFGRSIVGNAGILLTRVEHLKPTAAKNFAIVDAAMNDLIRPTLYQAHHAIAEVKRNFNHLPQIEYDIVGPVCESGDWLARSRLLAIAEDDLLAIGSAGAYGMTQSSNYNSRPRACEVMVDGDKAFVVRERESIPSLFALERFLPST